MQTAPLDLLSSGLAELKAAHAAQSRAITLLEQAINEAVKEGLKALPATTATPSEHRREHRPGTESKITSDRDLQIFITARLDSMTFAEIASEIATHFPPARHVHPSTIHRWWQRQNRSGRRGAR